MWADEAPTAERCRFHPDRVVVYAITGPRERFTACDAPGCRRDAEADHRLVHGAGCMVAVRTRYGADA